jgi:adenylate cyclase class IV
MIEARTFSSEIDSTKKILEEKGALFKGEYVLRDRIYSSHHPLKGLSDEFLRVRSYQKNIWNDSNVIVAVKIHEQKEIGLDTVVPLKKGFVTEEEALKFVEENLLHQYKYEFEFNRTGWQYDLGDDQIDLEKVDDLENFYTVEFKSSTVEGLKRLEKLLKLTNVIRGPIASHMKGLLSRGSSVVAD